LADSYAWAGGREAVLRFGPPDGPLLLVAPALFEEANRTRAFTVAILRNLAARGIGTALPDLPGTNDSLIPTENARLADWRAAFAASVGERRTFGFAIRGGALLDGDAKLIARCHFAPVTGASLIRDMKRARHANAIGRGAEPATPSDARIELAGNHLSPDLVAALDDAEPSRADRMLRLASDPAPCDRAFAGRALWRASEPDVDAALAAALADDLAAWVLRCGG
jgi:hypothetical protein